VGPVADAGLRPDNPSMEALPNKADAVFQEASDGGSARRRPGRGMKTRAPGDDAPGTRSEQGAVDTAQQRAVPRILIAEDDPLISGFLEKGLRATGYSTHVVDDGEQAARAGLSGDYDLVILDLVLPLRDGFQVLQDLRAKGKELPVVVVTARPDLRDKVACLNAGANDYMTKPFRFERLLARMRELLRAPGSAD
jgi:CheY-like chemotaxis protein